jgi:hypothetical protein
MNRKIFLYFITDTVSGKSYYVDNEGNVQLNNNPTPLPQSPGGWIDNRVSFGRSAKYYGLNRTFTVPLKFVGDGATILRTLFWETKGINCDLTLIILKWNDETDIYELYYKGKIDLLKIDDNVAESVTVNVIEGGVMQKLKAYENTTFEIPMDGTIAENFLVKMNGYLFDCDYNYNVLESSNQAVGFVDIYIFPSFYILNNDGINLGVGFSDQIEGGVVGLAGFNNYIQTSSNFFVNAGQVASLDIEGELKNNYSATGGNYEVFFISSLNNKYPIQGVVSPLVGDVTIPVLNTIPLLPGEKLFLCYKINGSGLVVNTLESSVNVKTKTKYVDTSAWAIAAKDLFKILVSKVSEGKCLSQSSVLDSLPNIAITCGFALRKDKAAVLKTNMSDFFDSLNVVVNGCLGNIDEKLFFEHKEYVYNSDEVTTDLGEVSNLRISVADEYLFNLLKIGYPPQSYDEKLGQSEFNTTFVFKVPCDVIAQKELQLISKYRADMIGVEFLRSNPIVTKSITNNDSDNSVFFLNVDLDNPVNDQYFSATRTTQENGYAGNNNIQFEFTEGVNFLPAGANSIFTYSSPFPTNIKFSGAAIFFDASSGNKRLQILKNGVDVLFETTVPADGVSNAGSPVLTELFKKGDTLRFYVIEEGVSPSYSVKSASLIITFPDINVYPLKRIVYDNIEGVPNPETAYNIEELTPRRLFAKHGNYIRGVHHNLLDKLITFQSADKNPNLSTTLGGVTIKESADVPINTLDSPLFYPYTFEFDTKVPVNFVNLLTNSANGHIRFLYNGKPLYGFPLEVSAKPALNESQEWKLLVSPKTNLLDLVDLDINGLNHFDMGLFQTFIPFLCPVQFVPLGVVQPPQYHFKDMDGNFFIEQIKFWASQKNYFQPWQNNETISIQHQSYSLGPSKIDVIKCDGTIVKTVNLSVVVTEVIKDPAILYQGDVALDDLAEGLYYLLLTVGAGDTKTEFISEGIHVKSDWDMTLRFDYYNTTNKQSVVFSEGYRPSIRVHGWIDSYDPSSKFAVYEDEPADIELLNGIAYDVFKLNIAIDDGIPDWMVKKINRVMLLNSVNIDEIGYTRNGDSKWEAVSNPGNPKKYWSLEVRKSKNRDGITLSIDGELDAGLSVIYNVNTKGFGDGPSEDNIVQVTELD